MPNIKLKAARKAKSLTQKGLADAVGVARQTINAIEMCEPNNNPSISLCIEICKVLDKTLDDLFWTERT